MSYIEKEKALEFVLNNTPHINGETTMKCVERAIKEIPTADVVEVVRKPVKGYEEYYEVDQFGRVYSVDRLIPVDDNGRQYNKALGTKQMKQNMHSKGYKVVSLTKADQDKMIAAITKQYYQELFEDEANMQIKWIKMMCIGLYRSGHTQDEILIAIGQWRSLYRQNSRFNSDEEQEAWLAAELAKVFPDGFPEQVVQDFKKL